MKPKPFIAASPALILFITALSITLLSWDFKQSPSPFQQKTSGIDTVPVEKKIDRDKKIRDLDDALDDLDAAEMKLNMEQVQKEIKDAMKNIDMDKIKMEMDKAMKEVDMEKIKRDVEESVAKIDWDKMKAQLDEVKMINTEKLQDQMKEVQKNLEKMGTEIKKEMDKAKEKIEKAKAEMKEYKEFMDGLEKDGLLNSKEDYIIKHKDGELFINGKKASDDVYNKYRSFLERHKTFTIEKSGDDFNIRLNNHVTVI
jgi:chromosome segregation ATPase